MHHGPRYQSYRGRGTYEYTSIEHEDEILAKRLGKKLERGPPPRMLARHHQDYAMFSRESQPKPSFVTGILVGG